jgi:hypothetical protein
MVPGYLNFNGALYEEGKKMFLTFQMPVEGGYLVASFRANMERVSHIQMLIPVLADLVTTSNK